MPTHPYPAGDVVYTKDPYQKRAKAEGYASRAAYKLKEIQQKYRILRPGHWVIELGSVPGGWTEVILQAIGSRGGLICVDQQPMRLPPSSGLLFVQADILGADCIDKLATVVPHQVDVLLSDAAPATSGISIRDSARSAELCFAALEISRTFLKPGGALLVKIFAGYEQVFIDACKGCFQKVRRIKPAASKKRSREYYLLCWGFEVAGRAANSKEDNSN